VDRMGWGIMMRSDLVVKGGVGCQAKIGVMGRYNNDDAEGEEGGKGKGSESGHNCGESGEGRAGGRVLRDRL